MDISKTIHRINARTTIPDSIAKGIAALLVAVFALELVVRPAAGYFGAEVTRPLALLVVAVCFALFFAAAIRRLLGRATTA